MIRASKLISLLVIILILAGCSANDNFFKMDIQVFLVESLSNEDVVITASMKEAVITSESWVLFEVRSSELDAPIWLPSEYEGKGVYSAETDQLPNGDYVLIGHYYAGGGIHISQRYRPQT